MTSLSQIIPSMKEHYYLLNGRLLTHAFVQASVMLPPVIFDVFNSLLFCVLLVLTSYHVKGSFREITWEQILFGFAFLWVLSPTFNQPFLWIAGAMNYLLSAVLLMTAAIPYRFFFKEYKKESTVKNILLCAVCLILGFIAGYTSETVSAIFIVIQVLYLIAYIIKKYKVRLWMIFSIIGNFAGLGVMLSSPTYNQRSEIWGESSGLDFIVGAISKIPVSFKIMVYNLYIPFAVFALSLIAFLIFQRKKSIKEIVNDNSEKLLLVLIFMLSVFVFSMFNCVCDYFPERIWIPALLFVIISSQLLLSEIKGLQIVQAAGMLIITAAVICLSCIPEMKNAEVLLEQYTEREALIEEEKANNNFDLVLEPIKNDSKYTIFLSNGDISNGPELVWLNEYLARYYGLNSVSAKE